MPNEEEGGHVAMAFPEEKDAAPVKSGVQYSPKKEVCEDRYLDTTAAGVGLVPSQNGIRDFLRDYLGNSIHLVAIKPDANVDVNPNDIEGRHFYDDYEAAAEWAVRKNHSGFNVYWSVNIVSPGINKKPKKKDIMAIRFAHLDLDPPKDGAAWDKGQKLLKLEAMQCSPSFVIDSGNGLGAFWRLDEEVPSWN
jgi:hypothetical protein